MNTKSDKHRRFAFILVLAAGFLMLQSAGLRAQAPKPSAAKPPAAAPGKSAVSDADRLSFDQTKVVGQMNELEERMFRLADALKALEPENSSRLRLALKFAREELIQQQMKEVQQLLATVKLDEASTEQKQLIAKLQRLHDLLLSNDLNFQMQLERLRLIREILRQLDANIKEEDRERKNSTETASHQQQLAQLQKRRKGLEQLVAEQASHLEKSRTLTKQAAAPKSDAPSAAPLATAQEKTQRDTGALRKESAGPPNPAKNLEHAEQAMGDAVKALAKSEVRGAIPQQEQALASLKKELADTLARLQQAEEQVAQDRFAAMRRDQFGNRQLTDNITQSTHKLGESGAAAANELIRAASNMASAEEDLGAARAAPASGEQERALESLRYARSQLAEEAERLLDQLHGEVRKRVLEALVLMKEKQVAVREATQALQPRVKQQARLALASVAALGKAEGKIIEIGGDIVTLVEETEFAVALPAALHLILRSMAAIQDHLTAGDAAEPVVAAEKQVEADLDALLDAMKQMPSTRMSNNKAQKGNRDREKELNRLVAELKIIRLLQVRVNGETVSVDKRQPAEAAALSAAIRTAIKQVEHHQDEVRLTTERLTEQRGDELKKE